MHRSKSTRKAARALIECLESRQLLTATLTNLVNFDANPIALSVGQVVLSNNILYGATENGQIFSVPVSGGTPKLLATADGPINHHLLVANGKLFGTTFEPSQGLGKVFSLPITGGSIKTLATFNGFNGTFPNDNLILSGNTLYGTAQAGGTNWNPNANFETGDGVVFSVPATGGNITDLGFFSEFDNGSRPKAGLILVGNTLFGTASKGGANDVGTVFSMPITGGTITAMDSFDSDNGEDPEGELAFFDGNLFGLTSSGGTEFAGTVFSIPAKGGTINLLSSLDGVVASNPRGRPLISGDRLFFASFDAGTIASTPLAGGDTTQELLFNFDGGDGRPDQYITADSAGNLYGVTNEGGPNNQLGNGSLFKITGTNFGKASISGTIYNDANQSNTQNTTEQGLAGVTVFLDKNNDGILNNGEHSTVTGSNGVFVFTGQPAGTYHVREVNPTGFRRVAKSAAVYDFTLAAGATISGRNFALTTFPLVTGRVFLDVNKNGKLDPTTDTGLQGFTVYVDLNNDKTFQPSTEPSTTTDANGLFTFSTLTNGSLILRAIRLSGYMQTAPTSGSGLHITTSSGAIVNSGDFGESTNTAAGLTSVSLGEKPTGSTTTITAGKDYDVTAGGPGVGGSSDGFRFLYALQTGDFDVKVQVQSLTVAGNFATAGIMARTSLTVDSPDVYMSASPTNYRFKYRTATAATTSLAVTGSTVYPNVWVRLKRVGNVFTGFFSTNGTTWTQVSSKTIALPSTIFLGLAVASNSSTQTTTAKLRGYSNT